MNKTIINLCLAVSLSIMASLGYLIYSTNHKAHILENEALHYFTEAKTATKETQDALTKLANSNREQLLATLKKIRPAIGIATQAGKLIDIAKPMPVLYDLKLVPVIDSILLSTFPDEFKYKITTVYAGYRYGYRVGWTRSKSDSIKIWSLQPKSGEAISVFASEMYHVDSKGRKTPKRPVNDPIVFLIR